MAAVIAASNAAPSDLAVIRVKAKGGVGRMRSKFAGKFWWEVIRNEFPRRDCDRSLT